VTDPAEIMQERPRRPPKWYLSKMRFAYLLPSMLFLASVCSGSQFSSEGGPVGGGGDSGSSGSGDGGANSGSGGSSGGTTSHGGKGAGGKAAGGTTGHGGTNAGGASGASTGGPGDGGSGALDAGVAGAGSGGTGTGGTGAGGQGTGGNGTGGAGVIDAGPPVLTSCPQSPPGPDDACKGSFTCSYGSDPRPACRSTYTCTSGGTFLAQLVKCTAVKSCLNDYTTKPFNGAACSPDGDFCVWDNGLACACTTCAGPVCGTTPTWDCGSPTPNGCPLFPPNEGQPCEGGSSNVSCVYSSCIPQAGITATCTNRVWVWAPQICPG